MRYFLLWNNNLVYFAKHCKMTPDKSMRKTHTRTHTLLRSRASRVGPFVRPHRPITCSFFSLEKAQRHGISQTSLPSVSLLSPSLFPSFDWENPKSSRRRWATLRLFWLSTTSRTSKSTATISVRQNILPIQSIPIEFSFLFNYFLPLFCFLVVQRTIHAIKNRICRTYVSLVVDWSACICTLG